MMGAEPGGGFEARRRFGFAHFDGASGEGAWLERRAGGPLMEIDGVELVGDSLILSTGQGQSIRGVVKGDTIAGRTFESGEPINRVWLVRRSSPPTYERPHELWPGPVSDSTYQVVIDTAVPMEVRDGTTLMSYVARPVGEGPFGIGMERTRPRRSR